MRTLLAAALLLVTACVAYNDQCAPLVDRPNERIAILGAEVLLDRANARHANNAIGQVSADAFVEVFSESGKADFGVLNGGSLRAEGVCQTRNIVPPGPLTNGVLHEILLFENQVRAATITEKDVVRMFEHSVDNLVPDGGTINTPQGYFLQVSKEVAMTVDCGRPPNQRVTALKIGSNTITAPGREDAGYRVAMSSFILSGGDGYDFLRAYSDRSDTAPKFGAIDSNIAADFMRRNFNTDNGPKIVVDPARIRFINCATPLRPTN